MCIEIISTTAAATVLRYTGDGFSVPVVLISGQAPPPAPPETPEPVVIPVPVEAPRPPRRTRKTPPVPTAKHPWREPVEKPESIRDPRSGVPIARRTCPGCNRDMPVHRFRKGRHVCMPCEPTWGDLNPAEQ